MLMTDTRDMVSTSGVYCIYNMQNGKVYVGQSTNMNKRIVAHRKHAFNSNDWNTKYEYPLYRAIRKYGLNNFYVGVLCKCSTEQLDKIEESYIELLDSANPINGYNVMSQVIGDNRGGIKFNKDIISDIKQDLSDLVLTKTELVDKYSISSGMLSMINSGEQYYDKDSQYPLRKINDNYINLLRKYDCYLTEDNKICYNHICKYCGDSFTSPRRTLKYCSSSCSSKDKVKISLTEEQLIEMLTLTPKFSYWAEELNVSIATIKNWCKKYKLPSNIDYWRNL